MGQDLFRLSISVFFLRLLLTGTPLQNNLLELWSLLNCNASIWFPLSQLDMSHHPWYFQERGEFYGVVWRSVFWGHQFQRGGERSRIRSLTSNVLRSFKLAKNEIHVFWVFLRLQKNEIHVFWSFLSLQKIKFMFFEVF